MLRSFGLMIYFMTLAVAPVALQGRADYTPTYYYGAQGAGGGFNYNYAQSSYGGSSSSNSSAGKSMALELDPKKALNSDLRVAAREGRAADVRSFIKSGADVNSQSEKGETALMYAARRCSLETAKELTAAHADVNKRDVHGQNALMFAVLSACEPIVKLILKDPLVVLDATDDSKHTVVDYSVEATEVEVDGPSVKILAMLKKAEHRHNRWAGTASRSGHHHHHQVSSDA